MRRTRSGLVRVVEWCRVKCRAVMGAISFLLPGRWQIAKQRKRPGSIWLAALIMAAFLFMCPVIFRPSCYATAFTSTDFTYTGTYTWVDDGGIDFRLKFLTSGTFTPNKDIKIDLFIVGGGGGGGYGTSSGTGGGGGYTGTWTNISLTAGTAYSVVVGAGGNANGNGGASSFNGTYAKNGGLRVIPNGYNWSPYPGGAGGSGGGANGDGSASTYWPGGNGGSNGSNGQTINAAGGIGQGSTTREFGEASGDLYAGGGGGSGYTSSKTGGTGGAGGGGRGYGSAGAYQSGIANTGGGGGGNYKGSSTAGSGGSGIVIIRNKRAA